MLTDLSNFLFLVLNIEVVPLYDEVQSDERRIMGVHGTAPPSSREGGEAEGRRQEEDRRDPLRPQDRDILEQLPKELRGRHHCVEEVARLGGAGVWKRVMGTFVSRRY
jgi:hypothetical protein